MQRELCEEEIWKPVVGYEEFYEISNKGGIRSIARNYLGRIIKRKIPYIKKPQKELKGKYICTNLYKNGKVKRHYIHRLVLETFIGACPPEQEASHLNGAANDNRIENLIWETKLENHARRVEHGTSMRGELHGNAKLTKEHAMEMRKKYKTGNYTYDQLGKQYGISLVHAWRVINKERWAHI